MLTLYNALGYPVFQALEMYVLYGPQAFAKAD